MGFKIQQDNNDMADPQQPSLQLTVVANPRRGERLDKCGCTTSETGHGGLLTTHRLKINGDGGNCKLKIHELFWGRVCNEG